MAIEGSAMHAMPNAKLKPFDFMLDSLCPQLGCFETSMLVEITEALCVAAEPEPWFVMRYNPFTFY